MSNKRVLFWYFTIVLLFTIAGLSMSTDGWQWRLDHNKILRPMGKGYKELSGINKLIYGGHDMKVNIFQSSNATPTIGLFGDSYLRAYHSAIVEKYGDSDFIWFESPGCEFFSLKYFGKTTLSKMKKCKQYRNESLKTLTESKLKALILSQHWYASFTEEQVDSDSFVVQSNLRFNGPKEFATYVFNEVKLIKNRFNIPRIVIIGGPPKAAIYGSYWTSIWECIATPFAMSFDACATSSRHGDVIKFHDEFNHTLELLSSSSPDHNIDIINPYDALCDTDTCINFDAKHRPIYSDYGHLSIFGNRHIVDYFSLQFDEIFKPSSRYSH